MPIPIAPALLTGLGARIFLDFISRTAEPSLKDFILIGAWQGVALHYAMKTPNAGPAVLFGIVAKLFIEFNFIPDVTRCISTIVGVVLGVLVDEFLNQFFDTLPVSDQRRKKPHAHKSNHKHKRERTSRPRARVDNPPIINHDFPNQTMVSDITSVDSNSELIGPRASMTPLQREIAALRARASLADSERRRFKEERKWAIAQNNLARASQMKWEMKRYTALMQSCHRQADAKVLEAAGRSRQSQITANETNEQLPTPASSGYWNPRDDATRMPSGSRAIRPRRVSTSKHAIESPSR